uniref:Transthyretin/hydroxyisourate hydrolase domain-containing protein n=1 Tax=Plectus sambesii TaxID=2011161 RepID=A0A914XND0_9BILA
MVARLLLLAVLFAKSAHQLVDCQSISAHVLDSDSGIPAANVKITTSMVNGSQLNYVYSTQTDSNGRAVVTDPNGQLQAGVYVIHYDAKSYFDQFNSSNQNLIAFFPYAEVKFQIDDVTVPYEVRLLLNRYSYTVYYASGEQVATKPNGVASSILNGGGKLVMMMLITLLIARAYLSS